MPLHTSVLSARPRRLPLLAAVCAAALLAAVLPVSPALAFDDPTHVDGMVFDGDGAFIVNGLEHVELAPGLGQVQFERLGPEGRQQLQILRVQLTDSNLHVDYIGNETVTEPGTVSEFVDGAGAIAGVNGDFFDINNSSAPLGAAISRNGGLLKSADSSRESVAGFTDSGLGGVVEVYLEGTVVLPSGALPLAGINLLGTDDASVVVYNKNWGDGDRARSVGASGTEVLVGSEGTVIRTAQAPGSELLGDGVQAVVAKPGAAASALAALAIGDPVGVEYRLNPEAENLSAAVGGHPTSEPSMLKDGVIGEAASPYMRERHPRTGVGFSEDGRVAYFVVADGRQANAAGLTVPDLGQLMLDLGAWNAINLDGGGSSQMNARQPGDERTTVVNSPSDGYERKDANGLGIFLSTPGSNAVTRYDLRPDLDHEDAVRVFPGLHRSLTAVGITADGSSAAASSPTWAMDSASATVIGDGTNAVVTGSAAGGATLTASSGDATGSLELNVLGPLERITASAGLLAFGGAEESRLLTITGHDADGFQAPIDAADVTVSGDDTQALELVPASSDTFEVRAVAAKGSALLTFTVGGRSVDVPVTIGLDEVLFTDLSDPAEWTSGNDRAPGGSVEPAPGHEGDAGLTLTYDFTQSTSTRGQYAIAPDGGFELPGQPQKLTMWINGDGSGAWPRLQFRQADGITANLNGPEVTWTGWQQAEFLVPDGVEYPLTFQRFRLMETKAASQYRGQITISSLAVAVAPEVERPQAAIVEDSVVGAEGSTDASPLRVAVMSDAQFVARNPESEMVVGARRALREIIAAEPDMLVINGDFVDEASPEDFDLARRILDEELAGSDIPWYYVPGNHEIMGGEIENFKDEFGQNFQTVDRNGTRFVMLDTSTGSVSGKLPQLDLLQDALADAAESDDITGVVLLQHHPIDDPLPTKASQLSNRDDAELLREWLEEFRESSGKSAAFVGGHVGVFHAMREDGISYLINGNSGKAPHGSAFGDFTGWTMLGIDPSAGEWASTDDVWLTSEVNARVDTLKLSDAGTVQAGTRVDLAPVISQPGIPSVEVAWPMSYTWAGSEGVHVGAIGDAPAGAIGALDPRTHVFTALAPGSGSASLTVNGVVETIDFTTEGGIVMIEGDALQGEELVGRLIDWQLPDDSELAYQWLRDGEPIADAVSRTYRIDEADAGHRLSLRVAVVVSGGEPVVFTSAETATVPMIDVVAPTLSLSAEKARPGDVITVTGDRFSPEVDLVLWLHSEPVRVGTATTSVDGSFRMEFIIPAETSAGAHSLRATDPDTGLEAAVALTVITEDIATSPSGDGQLGTTGGESPVWVVVLGVLLVLSGSLFVGWRIRRRSHEAI